MSTTSSLCSRFCAALLFFAAPALSPAASVLYTNFLNGSGYSSSQGNPIGSFFDGSNYAEASSFLLGGDASFSSLRIALSCFGSCADPFSVTLSQDAGSRPGGVLEAFAVAGISLGPLGTANPPVVLNSLLSPLLSADTRYWITVSSGIQDSLAWNLNSTGDRSITALSMNGGATWFSPAGTTPGAFEVNGVTPEPESAWLVVSGLLVFGFWTNYRRQ